MVPPKIVMSPSTDLSGQCAPESMQFCGLEIVETAAALATAHFNHGAGAIAKVLQEMGCYHGHYTTGQLKAEDEGWIKQSIWKEKEEKKRGESRGEGGGRVWKEGKLMLRA